VREEGFGLEAWGRKEDEEMKRRMALADACA